MRPVRTAVNFLFGTKASAVTPFGRLISHGTVMYTAIWFSAAFLAASGAPMAPRVHAETSIPGVATAIAAAPRAQESAPARQWWSAINQVDFRVVQAHIQKSLLPIHGIPHAKAGGFVEMNGITFSRRRFPITLTSREEWPPVLGGCRSLLTRAGYERALHAIEPLARAPVKHVPILQRVLIQNALWDMFDSVYYQGVDPWYSGVKFHRRRWQTLLLWLAHDISHIAVPKRVLAGYRSLGVARRRVLGPKLWRRAVELYSFQQPTIHAAAVGFRRVVRIYLYSPKTVLAALPKAQFLEYCRGEKILGAGAIAIEVEDAIAVLPGGVGLVPTRIPVIARSYRVVYSGRGNPILDFAIYRFPRRATKLQSKELRRLPGSFGAWALLNLPTIPNGSTGALARFSVVCAQCHFPGEVRSFRSGIARPEARYFRITRSGTGFVRMRTLRRKKYSIGYDALKFYCSRPLPATRRTQGSTRSGSH